MVQVRTNDFCQRTRNITTSIYAKHSKTCKIWCEQHESWKKMGRLSLKELWLFIPYEGA